MLITNNNLALLCMCSIAYQGISHQPDLTSLYLISKI